MHPESEQRAAHLAVSRYGAAAAKVQLLYQQVVEAQNKGRSVDFLATLVRKKLLTHKQADELRAGLDSTHFDSSPHTRSSAPTVKNGTATAVAPKPNGELPAHDLSRLGDYRILRRLGEGGMGSVYLAYQEGDQQHVAIKVLTEQLATSQTAVDRFYREAKSGALLNHPNIVRILGIGKDQATGSHYLVMEYVDGPSALELLGRRGKLSVGDAVHITLDVARALEHAHSRNIIHRDIKPDNILLTRSGLAKLTDLGLAKRTDEASHLTAARTGFGTPYYMPYEQAVNAKYADGRSDIYALGATLYQLVAGEVPFQGSNHLEIVEKKSIGEFPPARSHNAAVPQALDDILDKMLAREPADRYQTASELIVDLERSGLCPQLPSFVDANLAMQDPVVRERLAAQGQATAHDMQLANRDPRSGVRKANPDVWYLRFRDKIGRLCKAKLTTEQVLTRICEGHFAGAEEMEASHHHSRDFRPLESIEAFAVVAGQAITAGKLRGCTDRSAQSANKLVDSSSLLATLKQRSIPRLWLLGSLGTAVAIVVVVLARVFFWP